MKVDDDKQGPKQKFSFLNFITVPGGLVITIFLIRLLYRYIVYDTWSLF